MHSESNFFNQQDIVCAMMAMKEIISMPPCNIHACSMCLLAAACILLHGVM